ncbi:MAG TPA: chemotaxis protein CheW [Verrucomicrobiae bacterium]|nr:chemotaxis protein CheW [Verrucomicrobiae bacterium]
MIDVVQLVIFRLEGLRYALRLEVVERILQAVEITALPKAPDIVLGVIEMGKRVVPVFNARQRFRLTEREIQPSDHFLIARTARRTVALVIDEAEGVIETLFREVVHTSKIVPRLEHVQGIARFEDGLVLIHDLEKFLSLDEEQILDEALRQEARHGI